MFNYILYFINWVLDKWKNKRTCARETLLKATIWSHAILRLDDSIRSGNEI